MKKLIFSSALVLSLGLAACGGTEEEPNADTSKEEVNTTEEQPNESSESTETNTTKTEESATSEDIQEDENFKGVNTYTNKDLGITGEVGPMKYEISSIQLKKLTPKTEETAALFDVGVGEEVNAITIEMAGENTSTEDMTFYLGQATIITNTKEQLEPDMFLSEHIEGDYLGQVRHEGHNVYFLKNSSVDDLTSIEIRVSAPQDSNFNSVGEDVKHVIEVNK